MDTKVFPGKAVGDGTDGVSPGQWEQKRSEKGDDRRENNPDPLSSMNPKKDEKVVVTSLLQRKKTTSYLVSILYKTSNPRIDE